MRPGGAGDKRQPSRPSSDHPVLPRMAAYEVQKVLSVHHWNESLFTFTSTRATSLRFESGHFVMVGLMVDGRALLRAYSIASAHWEEHLEFFSIKVQDGPLTSRLQHLKVGDDVLVGRKPTGTLVITDLLPGRFLYLFATGTGLAPFMSIIRDPDTYERFEKIILVHGVRKVDELAYADLIAHELPQHEHLGELVRDQLVYYPTVTREPFRNQGRLPDLIANGKLCSDIGFPQIDPKQDRAMICGGPAMLKDMRQVLDAGRLHHLHRHRPRRRLRDRARVRREVDGRARRGRAQAQSAAAFSAADARFASSAFAERDTGFLPSTPEMKAAASTRPSSEIPVSMPSPCEHEQHVLGGDVAGRALGVGAAAEAGDAGVEGRRCRPRARRRRCRRACA